MLGAGKYDNACTVARLMTRAEVALVIILNGDKGSGFSMQGDEAARITVEKVAELLEAVAAEIRSDAQRLAKGG